ncbi:MAG: DedA family protein [Acidobacteriales bacterium]|nr:DedA family protein [Terriglobales bacterium]
MAEHIFELLRGYLAAYGYWAIALALLLENSGLPVPGETVLLLASFLAYSEHRLHLPDVILVGVCAATLGDNIGFALGHFGGRPLLERYQKAFRIKDETVAKGERLFERHGAITVFFARFVAGLRVFAGPLAGVLRMHWAKFALANFLGALLWVSTISCAGYFFGRHWEALIRFIRSVNLGVAVVVVGAALFWWWRNRTKRS